MRFYLRSENNSKKIILCILLLLMVCVAAVSAGANSISPTSGSQNGGTFVTITGTFATTGTTNVNFSTNTWGTADSVAATGVTVTATSITATTPAHAPGTVNVLVINQGDTSVLTGAYTYTGAPPTFTGINGGTDMVYVSTLGTSVVTLSGTNLATPYYVTFGGTQNSTTDYIGLASTGTNGFILTMKAPAHAAGLVTVTITTPNGSASRGNFTYQSVPVITGVSPAYGTTAGGTSVTITGTGGFSGATKVYFGNAAATGVTVVNAVSITATTPPGTAGATFVNITTPGGVSANTAGLFTYYASPVITSISPTSGSFTGGNTVTITGSGFSGASAVTFGSTAATSYTVNSATQITAIAPASTSIGAVTVTVTTPGGTGVKANVYTYTAPVPTITSISPTSGSFTGGNTVTITGSGFTGATSVTFGSKAATGVTVVSDTQITAIAPASTSIGYVTITVITPGGTGSKANAYIYVANVPTITSVSPSSGPTTGGTFVTITGSSLTGATSVTFNGVAATGLTVISDTQITVYTPAYPAGTSYIAVTTPGGSITYQNAYTYTAPVPTITSISPTTGPAAGGTLVTIIGSGFLFTEPSVTFGSVAATGVVVISNTQITAIAPQSTSIGAVAVTVTTPGGSAYLANAYTYTAAVPTFTSISPTSGSYLGGTLVTITGTNLLGATAVTFDGISATSYTVNSATQITAYTPAHAAGAVSVTVTTPGGSASMANAYTYTLSVPTITSISPISGSYLGGTFVTITGSDFAGATAVTFDGTSATSYTVNSATQITAYTPAHASGAVTVIVTTPGGTASKPNAFTYITPVPALTTISPTSGSTTGGTSVTITGTNLLGATAVTFDGISATSYTVNSATQITAYTPAHAAGTTSIYVTTPGGTASMANAYTYYYAAVPTITGISPTTGSTAGGNTVSITGSGLTGASVTFGSAAATGVTVVSANQITAIAPASNSIGAVTVTVTTPGGTASMSNAYTYTAAVPTITSISPTSGSTAGGNIVSITGSGLTGASAVTFGGTAATGVTVVSDTQITAYNPAHTSGVVTVTVTTPGGSASKANAYTYTLASSTLSFQPGTATVSVGSTTTYAINLDTAANGLSGYNITIALSNPSIGKITGVTYPSWASMRLNSTMPAGSAWFQAVDLTGSSGTTNIALCTVTVLGDTVGTTTLAITSNKVEDRAGGQYTPTLTTAQFAVTSSNTFPKPGGGYFPSPTDPNNDGKYEDLDGNGWIGFNDVLLFYKYIDPIGTGAYGPVSYFDYDGSGFIGFNDVVWLYNMT